MNSLEAALEIAAGDRPFVLVMAQSGLDLGTGSTLVAFQQYASRGMTEQNIIDLLTSCLEALKEEARGEDPS